MTHEYCSSAQVDAADATPPGRVLDLPLNEITADDLNRFREAVTDLLTRYGVVTRSTPDELGLRCE